MYLEAEHRKKIRFGEDGNALIGLIIVNAIVFLLLNFVYIIYLLSNWGQVSFFTQVLHWVTLPASADVFLQRPWTLLTHMISHFSVWQILSNMLWLWAFGYILQDLTGNRHIVPLYIYGALTGAILFLASFNLIPAFRPMASALQYYGGAAGVMAVAVATTFTAPTYRIFPMIHGGIPLWVVTSIYVVIQMAGLATQAFPYQLAYLGGAMVAPLYIRALRNGKDYGAWMHQLQDWFLHLFDPQRPSYKKKDPRKQLYYKADNRKPYTKTTHITQQRIDEILDKINLKGYHFLTEEEKEILKRASEDEAL